MKKLFLLPILLCTCMMQLFAATWTDTNGVTWTFVNNQYWENNSYHERWTITGVANYGDEVVVPEVVYEGETPHTIVKIGSGLFQDNRTLTSVTLPTTIKTIDNYAFKGCQALTTVTGTENCETFGYQSFESCSNLAQIDLSSCKTISSYAFQSCSNLSNVISLAQCHTLDFGAFRYCTSLQSVNLGDNTRIGEYAFYNCSSLTSVGSLKGASIGNYAFYGCSSLTAVDISQSASLGAYAFYGCSNLTTVGDLSAYTAISDYVFYGCSKLESVDLSNCRSIGNSAFCNCKKLVSVDLGEVTTVGTFAFQGCSKLETVGNISAFTSIPNGLFLDCFKLNNVNLPNVTTVGELSFANCKAITTLSLPKVTTVGGAAFYNCTGLTTIDLPLCTTILFRSSSSYINNSYYSSCGAFQGCTALTNISLPKVTAIGSSVFSGCSALTSISLPEATNIDSGSFQNCTALTNISLPKVQSIGSYAFSGCSILNEPSITSTELTNVGENAFNTPGTITLMATTPPALTANNAFGTLMVVRVPDAALATYKTADKWSDFKARIVGIGSVLEYNVNVTAQTDHSGLVDAIGEDKLGQVVTLKITGDINGYDIMVLRNKMDNLHYLDLADANIVANDYEYYTGYHTEDNVLGIRSFYNLEKLISVKLPTTLTEIKKEAFYGCTNLKNIQLNVGLVKIGDSSFRQCSNIQTIELPNSLKEIGSYTFCGLYDFTSGYNNPRIREVILPEGLEIVGTKAFAFMTTLVRVAFPSTLKKVGEGAFMGTSLNTISLPTNLQSIANNTFNGCSSLTEVRIPSSIMSIGNEAFSGCSRLNDVYTYIAEPTQINMNTFSTYTTATLHVPTTSFKNYWYDTEWSQFRDLQEFDAEYEYFYINKDFTISDDAGTIHGEGDSDPNADLNPGSGLIVETTTDDQGLDEVHIKVDGDQSGSVLADDNLTANKVYYDIKITAGRWYFLSLPFRVKITNITAPGRYVFRYYDGSLRATGISGWLNWLQDWLLPGQGYIFQCNKSGILSLCVERVDMNWKAENHPREFEQHAAQNQQDASWNFMGNPHHSYYDIEKTGYTQPITVWNGTAYEAVRPGDDDYSLRPFEAFFVQKPENQNEMNFPVEGDNDGRYTYLQWKNDGPRRAARRRAQGVDVSRQMINLTLSDGQTTDKTRVVFNEKQSKNYEMACDAPKFFSSENVAQLYSLDQSLTKYAINERPMGEVRLGYIAANDGEMTISAQRMDQPMMLRDNVMQITHDLTMGDYTFSTKAGVCDDRFTLVANGDVTSVGKIRKDTGVSVLTEKGGISFSGIEQQEVTIYSLSGTTLASHVQNGFIQLPNSAYIVKVDNNTTKLLVK